MTKSILLRLREKDTPIGVSAETLDKLCAVTGMSKTAVVHLALVQYAITWGIREEEPYYEPDDGPLTKEQLERIQQLADEESIRLTGKPMPAADDPCWIRLFN